MTHVERRDLGLLLLRLGIGGSLVAHGSQKLFGWFGGGGIEGTAAGMEQMGYRPGRPSAIASGLIEAGGGALLALGLATPVTGAAVTGEMASAAAVHAPNGYFAQTGGLELPASVALVTGGIAIAGPGRLSLDHALGHAVNRAWMVPVALAVAAGAAVCAIKMRARSLRETQEDDTEAPDPEGL